MNLKERMIATALINKLNKRPDLYDELNISVNSELSNTCRSYQDVKGSLSNTKLKGIFLNEKEVIT